MNKDNCLGAKELSRYLHISYGKATELVTDPSFPTNKDNDVNIFSKTQVIAWAQRHINVIVNPLMQPLMQREKNT
jgi:hypothetical protein